MPGPLYLIRGLRKRARRVRRYSQIGRILVRRGMLAYLRGTRRSELQTQDGREQLAAWLRLALEDGSVTFIKLGQLLATRRDLLPAEFIDELSGLQDNAAQVPWSQVREVLRSELGADVDDVFESFDRAPLAAASIAQVHSATLSSGQRVVVKVRRPGSDTVVAWDLDHRRPTGDTPTALDAVGPGGGRRRPLRRARVMIEGIFHADPHPGKVLRLANGQLGLLGFGSVGRIDAELRGALQRLLLAVDRGDPAALHDALLEIVQRPDGTTGDRGRVPRARHDRRHPDAARTRLRHPLPGPPLHDRPSRRTA